MNNSKEYRAIIIDDESKLREVLKIKLNQFCPQIRIAAMAKDVKEGYEAILNEEPELVFLDISMPGESGFDLLNKFEKIDFEIIFVTGYNEYALDALKVSAVDYLLKPVKTEDLKLAVQKATSQIDNKDIVQKYDLLKHNIHHIGDQDTRITIPGTHDYQFVSINQIVRCEGWQKYTKIHLVKGDVLVSSYNIGIFKEMLEKYNFFNTHKSHLINTTLIEKYQKDGTVIMNNGDTVPVARRRKDDFMTKVIKYMSIF